MKMDRALEGHMLTLSLIVPTYNRSDLLMRALGSFLRQSLPSDRYEIIVVDNNSTDRTKAVVEEAAARHPAHAVTYLFEQRQGLHHARNRGILMARSPVVVFGDDDIVAEERWLESIEQEFLRNDRTGVAGGMILPAWDGIPEPWIYDYGTEKVHPVFAYLDYGNVRQVLENGRYVYGCNFAIRRELAIEAGGSYPDVFPPRLQHLSGTGEYGLIRFVRKMGYDVVYLPDALVHHMANRSRATLEYFTDRYERWAVEAAYDAFREQKKLAAAKGLARSAFLQIWRSLSADPGKINATYDAVIKRRSAIRMLKQVARVLFDRSLYRHIRRESYF